MAISSTLRKTIRLVSVAALAAAATACDRAVTAGEAGVDDLSLRQKVAQKLMLDIRYYCADRTRPAPEDAAAQHCSEAVTALPPALEALIAENDLGGIILFADNLEDSAQIIALNRDLQRAAAQSASGLPLLIGVDQEGGRVNRLPRDEAAAFAGNMAIGATHERHGVHFAAATAEVMAEQLKVLGFNVNFAPTLDVNSNPENPVINVRSYSEAPQVVADLGAAAVTAFQQHGIAATVKHFPGHGDTSVDSHTGLPRVERSKAEAAAVDLLPFAQAIQQAAPALTMTAHIQYPSLDDTTLVSRSGEEMLAPATLSRRILTDILREQMGYQGVVVTDSLNMAGISDYFSPEEAVVKTFAAGADIALMPIKIRYPEDLQKLEQLISRVVGALEAGELSEQEFDTSLARVLALKQNYVDAQWAEQCEDDAVAQARTLLASEEHRVLADQLATAALSSIFAPQPATLPVIGADVERVQVLAPNPGIGEAFRIALSRVTSAEVQVVIPHRDAPAEVAGSNAEVLLVASVVPGESAVELGGMEDLPLLQERITDVEALYEVYRQSLEAAKARNAKTAFVSMRSPYEAARFENLADVHLASFDYKAFIGPDKLLQGPIYHALAKALVSAEAPAGRLPVTVTSLPAVQASQSQAVSEG